MRSATNQQERATLLTLEQATIGYKSPIYSPITTQLLSGELVAILGANGTGKSTLLKSIASLIPLVKGEIKVAPKEGVVYIPSQTPRVKHLSLKEMIAVGFYKESNWLGTISQAKMEEIDRVLEMVGLSHHKERDITTLSDGEFQRATIARGLIQKSKILVMDEPTAFLDIANRVHIINLLRRISSTENRSILFSTHDIQQALKVVDRVWILGYNGFIEGSPTQLIEEQGFNKLFKDSNLSFDSQLLTFV